MEQRTVLKQNWVQTISVLTMCKTKKVNFVHFHYSFLREFATNSDPAIREFNYHCGAICISVRMPFKIKISSVCTRQRYMRLSSHSLQRGSSRATVRRDGSRKHLVSSCSISENKACTLIHPENQGQHYQCALLGTCTKDYHCPSSKASISAGHSRTSVVLLLLTATLGKRSLTEDYEADFSERHAWP